MEPGYRSRADPPNWWRSESGGRTPSLPARPSRDARRRGRLAATCMPAAAPVRPLIAEGGLGTPRVLGSRSVAPAPADARRRVPDAGRVGHRYLEARGARCDRRRSLAARCSSVAAATARRGLALPWRSSARCRSGPAPSVRRGRLLLDPALPPADARPGRHQRRAVTHADGILHVLAAPAGRDDLEVRERRLHTGRVHRSDEFPDADVAGGLVEVDAPPLSSAAP